MLVVGVENTGRRGVSVDLLDLRDRLEERGRGNEAENSGPYKDSYLILQ
jgi:hypothetical protein